MADSRRKVLIEIEVAGGPEGARQVGQALDAIRGLGTSASHAGEQLELALDGADQLFGPVTVAAGRGDEAVAALAAEIRGLGEAVRLLERTVQSGRGVRKLGDDAADARKKVKSLEDQLDELASDLERTGSVLEDVGSRFSIGITAPIAAAAAAALTAHVRIDDAMTGLAKTVDVPEARIRQFRREFAAMAEDVAGSTADLARIGEEAGQLGISPDAVLGFTEVIAALRVATDLGDQAASSLARLRNITGDSESEFDRLASTIVALGNDGASTEAEIVDMALRIAGAGRQIALATAETLGFAAALSSVGIESEAGGTAISRVFAELANAVASGGQELQTFARVAGVSAEQFRQQFQEDAASAVIAFVEGLRRASDAGQNVFAVLEALGLGEARVRDALLRAAGAGDLLRHSIELGNRAWRDNTALAAEAERFYQRLGQQIEDLTDKAINIAAELGEALEPTFRAVITVADEGLDVLRATVRVFADLPGPIQAGTVAAAAFAAAIPVATLALGQFVQTGAALVQIALLPRIAQGATAAAGAIAGAGGLTAAVASLAPIVAVGAPLLAGLGAIAAVLLTIKVNAEQAKIAVEESREAWKQGIEADIGEGDIEGLFDRLNELEDRKAFVIDRIRELKDSIAIAERVGNEQLAGSLGRMLEGFQLELIQRNADIQELQATIESARAAIPLEGIVVTVEGGGGGLGRSAAADIQRFDPGDVLGHRSLTPLMVSAVGARLGLGLAGDRVELPSLLRPTNLNPFGPSAPPQLNPFAREPGPELGIFSDAVGKLHLFDPVEDALEDVADDSERTAATMVAAFGGMVQAAVLGADQMEQALVGGITQIVQAAVAESNPIIGAGVGLIGGLVGALFGRRDRPEPQPVRVVDFDRAATEKLRERREGPDTVIVQLIDPITGETRQIEGIAYTLERRRRVDAVERLPPRRS